MVVIDVKNKSLGRAASEAAALLRGKSRADFKPNRAPDIELEIINVSKIRMTGRKAEQKKYKKYSGYPGGLKYTRFQKIKEERPAEIFKRAVWGMLPKNKLRSKMIKNLVMKESNE